MLKSWQSSTFKKHALRHINKVLNETTSFVFITSKLLNAFHHIFKMFTNSSIAIIDLELVKRLRTTQKKNSHLVTHLINSSRQLVSALIALWIVLMFLLLSAVKVLSSKSTHSNISTKCQMNRHYLSLSLQSYLMLFIASSRCSQCC